MISVPLIPAGQALGPLVGDEDEPTEVVSMVRLGDDIHACRPGEYIVWLSAFGGEGRKAIGHRVAGAGVAGPTEPTVDALLERGLLASLDTARDRTAAFARYVFVAQGVGLGNADPTRPEQFTICDLGGEPLAVVAAATYLVWATSYRESLSRACELTAERLQLSVDDVVGAVAADLPALVACGAGVLDLADDVAIR